VTLILAMCNLQQAVIVSDRRLTRDGVPFEDDDESNKVSLFDCRDARLAVAYTGLSDQGDFVTRQWLPEALAESAAPDFQMGPIIERFTKRATRDFAKIKVKKPSAKHLSVVFAGYCYDETPPRCYCWLVSNFEGCCDQHRPPDLSSDRFMAFYYRDKRPTEENVDILLPAGAAWAVTHQDYESLHTLLHENKSAQALVDKGIEVIRTANQSLNGKFIGKQCNSIVLPSNPQEEVVGGYHSAKVATRHYVPSYINARGDGSGVYSITEGWFEVHGADDKPLVLSVPKVGRNHTCPCGSGLKYKKCHGAIRGQGNMSIRV
jgi:SEC-C motif